MKGKKPEKTSWAWWILPVLGGWLGGIIGYFILKRKNKRKALLMIPVGILFTIVWFLVRVLLMVEEQ